MSFDKFPLDQQVRNDEDCIGSLTNNMSDIITPSRSEVSVPCGLLLVRQLKDGFHHQGSPQDTDHDLDRNDNVVYKQNYGYASKQSNSIALDYDISKYTKNYNFWS